MHVLIIHAEAAYLARMLAKRFPEHQFTSAPHGAVLPDSAFDAEVIVAMARSLTDDMMGRFTRLRWVQALTTGTDGFFALKNLPHDVLITSARGIHGPAVSEMVFMQMLALSRGFADVIQQQRQHLWQKKRQLLLCGKTAVIVGIGIIASELALKCKAFGMHTIGISNTPRAIEGFDEVVARSELTKAAGQADYLIALMQLDASTHNLINAEVIQAMRASAYFINISRGGVCDEEALLKALALGTIAGAALDVFSVEPLPKDHPLWDAPNVIITPHLGGESDDYMAQVCPIIEHNLICMADGRMKDMLNLVPRTDQR
jgi:D-2-hydroxyacid dehydrogenase (NADP+)